MDQNRITDIITARDYRRMTARLVSAYIKNHRVPASEIADLIANTAEAIINLAPFDASDATRSAKNTLKEVQSSITDNALISFIDGKPYQTLKRHLTANGFTPETYKQKYGLPANYPMVAPAYSTRRAAIASAWINRAM